MMHFSNRGQLQPLLETLEPRKLFSVSIVGTAAPVLAISPQLTAKLGPSAVEGTYKGIVVNSSSGASYEIKLVLTHTSARLTVEGLGTYSASLSSTQFLKIREGTFDVDFKYVSGLKGSVSFTGKVKDSGLKITGDYLNSGGKSGTFTLKKAA